MSFFYLTPFKPHKPAQKTKVMSHSNNNLKPTSNTISINVIQGPQNPMFQQKAQTHTSPKPENRRNRNKNHPINGSPTLINFGTHAPR